ncbi:M23 family metallopeptidase [Paractinoplanes lichenicola]|uniref:M23 family metallopeptidase n=1 Tax=Paractinoplanes lichenicola TaxID=2802976 RepID=A0ABS1VJJ1_9ACTN|nr:M23 family metallopeptidase [Actinoplanes lichenicola]MBL7254460.1 M23 family metallopeptidase [Actinoplanes lichenicola]
MSIPRPRKIALLVALVATLALLCCGGSVTALLVGGLTDEGNDKLTASGGCGKAGPIDPDTKLPRIRPYGAEQIRNAAVIINVGANLKMPPRAWVIAIATAMQESRLNNLGNLGTRNDHDSLGLFQQRPSTGWGTPKQVQDPVYSSTKFYQKLKTVPGWEKMPLTRAAQRVQISAYPDAYAKHEPIATQIVNSLADGAANAVGNSVSMVCASAGQIAASGWTLPVGALVGSGFRTASRPTHQGVDLIAGKQTPIAAAASGIVSKVKCDEDHDGRRTCNVDGYPGKGGCGWMVEIQHAGNVMTRYCHMIVQPFVREGQEVTAGEIIGRVGSSGNSSGPHLHYEVHLNNDRSSAGAIDPVQFMREQGTPLGGSG